MDLETTLSVLQKKANSKLEQFCRNTGKSYCVYIPLNQKEPEIKVEIYDVTPKSSTQRAVDRVIGLFPLWLRSNFGKGAGNNAPPQNVVDYVLGNMPKWVEKSGKDLNFSLHPSIQPAPATVGFQVSEPEEIPEPEIS